MNNSEKFCDLIFWSSQIRKKKQMGEGAVNFIHSFGEWKLIVNLPKSLNNCNVGSYL